MAQGHVARATVQIPGGVAYVLAFCAQTEVFGVLKPLFMCT